MSRSLTLSLVLLVSFSLAGCCWRPCHGPGYRNACQKQTPCASQTPCPCPPPAAEAPK